MKNIEKIKNYLLFLLSLFTMGLGISLITKLELGTSAISSVPYVLSLIFPFSFGTFTFVSNVIFVLIQRLMLGGQFEKSQYGQMLVGPFLGFFIDLGMLMLKNLNPMSYLVKLLLLALGCLILAFSIFLQLRANVITNPGEGMVKAIVIKSGMDFGKAKIVFDLILIVISATISYVFLNNTCGIGEGTIATAVLVGFFLNIMEDMDKKIKEGE